MTDCAAIQRFQDLFPHNILFRIRISGIYPVESLSRYVRLWPLVISIAVSDKDPSSLLAKAAGIPFDLLKIFRTTLSIDPHEVDSNPTAALQAILAATSETSAGEPVDPQRWTWWELDSRY